MFIRVVCRIAHIEQLYEEDVMNIKKTILFFFVVVSVVCSHLYAGIANSKSKEELFVEEDMPSLEQIFKEPTFQTVASIAHSDSSLKEVVRVYFENKKMTEFQKKRVDGILISALYKMDLDTAKYAIMLGADVNQRDGLGHSPLHVAAGGLLEFVDFLLDHNASVNLQDCNCETPLHWAAELEQQPIVELLLAHGAYTGIQNKQYKCPIDVTNNEAIKKILCSRGCKNGK